MLRSRKGGLRQPRPLGIHRWELWHLEHGVQHKVHGVLTNGVRPFPAFSDIWPERWNALRWLVLLVGPHQWKTVYEKRLRGPQWQGVVGPDAKDRTDSSLSCMSAEAARGRAFVWTGGQQTHSSPQAIGQHKPWDGHMQQAHFLQLIHRSWNRARLGHFQVGPKTLTARLVVDWQNIWLQTAMWTTGGLSANHPGHWQSAVPNFGESTAYLPVGMAGHLGRKPVQHRLQGDRLGTMQSDGLRHHLRCGKCLLQSSIWLDRHQRSCFGLVGTSVAASSYLWAVSLFGPEWLWQVHLARQAERVVAVGLLDFW